MSFLSGWMLTTVLGPSLTGTLFLSGSWQKFTLTIWKEDHFFHYSNISEFDFTGRLKHPLSCRQWPCPDVGSERLECTETFMLDIFLLQGDFVSFFSSYYISDATLRKFTQVNNSLIDLNSVKIESYGLCNLKLKIYDTIHCEDQWGKGRYTLF